MSTQQHQPIRTAAETYFEAWRAADFARLAHVLAPDVDFAGPMGTAHGPEEALGGLRGVRGMVADVEVTHRVVEGDDAITWFDLVLDDGRRLPVANWSHGGDGQIHRIRVTFDPRPLLG